MWSRNPSIALDIVVIKVIGITSIPIFNLNYSALKGKQENYDNTPFKTLEKEIVYIHKKSQIHCSQETAISLSTMARARKSIRGELASKPREQLSKVIKLSIKPNIP